MRKLPCGSLKSCACSSDNSPVNLHQTLQLSPTKFPQIPQFSPQVPAPETFNFPRPSSRALIYPRSRKSAFSLRITNSSPVDRKPSTNTHLFFYLIPDTSDQRQPKMSLHLKDVPHLFCRTSNQRQPTTVAVFKQIEAPHIWTSVTIINP